MTSVLDEIVARARERMRELEPLVTEYRQLERVTAQLRETGTDRPRQTSREAGRVMTRAQQSVRIVTARPGITTHEIADAMGIEPNYLYRVLPRLEREGRLVRRDGGWHAA